MRALINVRLPQNEDGSFINIHEFREILQKMGLKPVDMIDDKGLETDESIKSYCLQRAEPIFDRMPELTDEQKAKKEFSRRNIVYASDLPESSTLFMVTGHVEGEYRFRLLNPKIEDLQEGCKDFVLRVHAYNDKHADRKLSIHGKIEILEHGLEESTISGAVVESRWRAATKIARRDVLISAVGLSFFTAFSVPIFLDLIPLGNLHNVIDRLSTAMFTASIVSAITVYYTWRELTPVIQWTASYDLK